MSYYPLDNPQLPGTAGNSDTGVTAGTVTPSGNIPVEQWIASAEALDVLRSIDAIPQEFINRSEIDFHAYYAGAGIEKHRDAAAWDARFKDSVRRRWSLYRSDWKKFGPKALEQQTGEQWANEQRQ